MKDHPVRNSIYNVYFSPTKATQKIAYEVADAIAADRDLTSIAINLTKPKSRPVRAGGQENDVFLFASPVYSGRVPAVLMDCIDQFGGDGAKAVVVGVYGNRHYDDALLEAADLLAERGFKVIAAGAFIGEHSLTARVGTGRPDDADIAVAQRFGARDYADMRRYVANALRLLNLCEPVRAMVEDGRLSGGHARALLPLPAKQQETAAAAVLKSELSVRQTELLAKKLMAETPEKPAKDPLSVNYAEEAARELGERLGRGCRIVSGRKKGRIELEYYGVDDLNNLLDALNALTLK